MSKVQRLLSILIYINRKRKFTAQELASHFNVSVRTIQRDLLELGEWGVPLYGEQGAAGGYTVLKNKVLPPLFFTEDEGVALYFSFQSLAHYGALPFSSEIKTVLDKLYLSLDEATRVRIDELKKHVAFWNPMRPVEVPFLTVLLNNAMNGDKIKISYASKKGMTEKEIKPFGIFANDGFWYCPAHDYSKNDIRLYRVDRIASVLGLGKCDEPSMNLEEWFQTKSEGEMLPFKATLTANGMRRAANVSWLPSFVQEKEDGTGGIDSMIPTKEIRYTAEDLYSFGTDITIHEPVELKEEIVKKARAVLDLYFMPLS